MYVVINNGDITTDLSASSGLSWEGKGGHKGYVVYASCEERDATCKSSPSNFMYIGFLIIIL